MAKVKCQHYLVQKSSGGPAVPPRLKATNCDPNSFVSTVSTKIGDQILANFARFANVL